MSDNAKGILWALVATAMFTVVAAMAKVAVKEYHVLQILFFRQLVVFLSALPSIFKSFPQSLRTSYPRLHSLRLIGAFVALSCGIWAVSVLPLSTAITLGFSQVFFVALLAKYFLGELVGNYRICAVVVGFIGVIVVMRPGVEGFVDIHAFIPVVGALGAAMAITAVRRLSQSESTATLLLYQAVFVGVLAGIPLFGLWKTPDLHGFLFLLLMGMLATIGQWVGVKSLRLGEATVVGNIEYIKLIYASVLGYLLFAEIPDRYTIIGAALIIGASFILLQREMMLKKS